MPSHGVGQLLERAGLPFGRPSAQLRLGAHDGLGVEQVGELGLAALAEQLGQQGRVERQGGGATLGQRGVAVVEELRRVAEQQGLRERRRLGRRDLDDADPSGHHVPHEGGQRLGVEVVLEALADRLEQDREVGVLGRHGQQLRGPLALLPQRLTPVRPTSGEQQGAARGLAEPGAEHGRRAELRLDRVEHLVGIDHEVRQVDPRTGGLRPGVVDQRPVAGVEHVRQPQDDPVVGVHGRGVHAVPLAQPRADDDRPRRVHARAVGGVQDHPPVAELVPEPLDHQDGVRRQLTGRLALLAQVGEQVVGRPARPARPPRPARGRRRRAAR